MTSDPSFGSSHLMTTDLLLQDRSRAERVDICDTKIDNITFDEALIRIGELIEERTPSQIVTPNVDHLVKLQYDAEFAEVYRNASLVLADGYPLLWAAKYLNTPLKAKISGSDLLPRLSEISTVRGYRSFFLGGRPGAALKAAEVLQAKYPSMKISGTYCPQYGFEWDEQENRRIVHMIRNARPDILFVGLGAPKQEKWIYRYKDYYRVPVSIGIGISFEYIAGTVKRAPKWMQQRGFEWFWRLIHEPRRLWKRYLIEDMRFFSMVLRQKRYGSPGM